MKIIIIALLLTLTACENKENAESVLEKTGYTDVQVDGVDFLGCGEGDIFRTKFTATTEQGKKVTGVICSGIWKKATIRYD